MAENRYSEQRDMRQGGEMSDLRAGWERIEAGWWAHDALGGIVRQRRGHGWACYPKYMPDETAAHVEPTLADAMKWFERTKEAQ
jgi:hypothetical protein